MKIALITGITGQDGSYLAEFLLAKGYQVHGIIRRASTFNTLRINHLYTDPHNQQTRLFLHYGDLSDPGVITEIIWSIKPDEVYHLGGQSHVKVSFEMPEYTANITGLGTVRVLEAIRRSGVKSRFYQASCASMFGASPTPQKETTPFYPRSPYAAAKVYAYWITKNYREGYKIFATNGILFSHESPRRGETFVTRKITRGVAHILAGKEDKLYLGNLHSRRDWGFAPEYVQAMWLMLQQDTPDDYVLGTGVSHTIQDFIDQAFSYAGVEIEWQGEGLEQKGIVKSLAKEPSAFLKPGQVVIEIDPKYFRPAEVDHLKADSTKAQKTLGWAPKMNLENIIKIMVDHDLRLVGLVPPGEGEKIANRG